ncbi:MAG: DUF192 domain-containing protein [Ignavibacteriaceae bacterium]|jgi:uncharacterized membrane protein (UPF0127 family)|nr:DUF192 domain-containing protein [Ignavibacteriaceae bacterium]
MSQKQIKKNRKSQSESNRSTKSKKNIYIATAIGIAIILFFVIRGLMKTNITENEYIFKKEGTISFLSTEGKEIKTIDMEVADTEYDTQLGLMFRKSMKETESMLFIFPNEEPRSFWMRNTYIPLDMIFVSGEKKIVMIQKNTKTLSDQSYPSILPAKYVVEVVGGFTTKYGIKEGDSIDFKR